VTAAPERPAPFEFSGGALCLDFANTLGDRPRSAKETLSGPQDLLRWAGEAGILEVAERGRLERAADGHPRAAREAFRRAIALREVLYRVFSGLAAGDRPAEGDLEDVNRALRTALEHLRIEARGEGFEWAWSAAGTGLDPVLWRVARSAAELLTSADVARVRECAAETCGWLFLDRSHARRRRWCDMKTCGNRAKARRHYRRKRRTI